MKVCECYKTRLKGAENTIQGYCIGTKECEDCSCGGDKLKCDFYEYIRERARLEQAELFKSTAPLITEIESPHIEVIGLDVNTLVKALLQRSFKEKQTFPWWVFEEIYKWNNKKYIGE